MKFLFGCIFAVLTTLHAQTIFLTEEFEYIKASSSMEYVADINHSLTIDNIQQAKWKPMLSSNLGGFNNYPSWTKLNLKNDTLVPQKVLIKNPRAGMDEIDIYIIRSNEISNILLGDMYSIKERAIPHRYSVEVIELAPNEEIQIISRLTNSIGSTEGEWEIFTRKYFIDFTMTESLWWGIFIGIYLALFFYSTPILLASRDKILALYFGGYVISSIGYQLAINGILYSWGVYGYSVNIMTLLLGILFFFFTILVILEFFKLTHHNGFLSLMLRFIVIILSLEVFLAMVCFMVPDCIRIFGIIIVCTSIFILTIWFFLLKNFLTIATDKIYRYIFLGYSAIFIAHTYQIMISLGFFSIHLFSIYSVSLGSILEMLFFTMGISLYIKQMQHETTINQKLLDFQMRFASIGRVVGNISHQWKMPMIRAGSLLTHIEALIHLKNHNTLEEIEALIPKIRSHFSFMQNTIDEFYSLYSQNTNKVEFQLHSVINDVWGMLSTKATSCDVQLYIKDLQETKLYSFEYSFAHIAIILIDNTLDIAKTRNIQSPKILIDILHNNDMISIIFEDNCGGIEQKPIESIFNNETSNKHFSQKTRGLGLSIVKLLINEKFGGTISASNTHEGAKFVLYLPMASKNQ